MTRVLAFVLLFAAITSAAAQDKLPTKDVPPGAVEQPVPKTDVRTFAVTATPAPVPALKYELLPKLRDRTPGNAAMDYHRAYMLRPNWPRDPVEGQKLGEKLIAWEEMPVEKLPVVEMKKFLMGYSQTFRSLDRAALCDRCDWDQTRWQSPNNTDLLLPEVQSVRELARAQKFRIRVDLAENDFDAAIRAIQSGYRLGKDIGEGTTMIQMLVGIAITSVFMGETEQFIARPGSPNLYWGLTTLPSPFIDPRRGLEGEALFFDNMFPSAKDLDKGPLSAEKANRILGDMMGAFSKMAGADPSEPEAALARLGLPVLVATNQADAKKKLIEMGLKPADVEKMPGAQLVALRSTLTFRSLSDDQAKAFSLPYPEARKVLAQVKERAAKIRQGNNDPLIAVFLLTLPATEKVYEATARTNRRLAGLRAVEAVRLHAAMNNGAPPKSLADVTLVPVPDDPHTGKPFGYTADGAKFTLTAPPPAGDQPHQGNNFRYEITIRGK